MATSSSQRAVHWNRGAEVDPGAFYSTSYSRTSAGLHTGRHHHHESSPGPAHSYADESRYRTSDSKAAALAARDALSGHQRPVTAPTGYTGIRPVVSYSQDIDEHEGNEAMRAICDRDVHYATRTRRDYEHPNHGFRDHRPDEVSLSETRRARRMRDAHAQVYDEEPTIVLRTAESAYTKAKPRTIPASSEVRGAMAESGAFDTDRPSAEGRYRSLTETRRHYNPHSLVPEHSHPVFSSDYKHEVVGRESAFSRNMPKRDAFDLRATDKRVAEAESEARAALRTAAGSRNHDVDLPPVMSTKPSQYEWGYRTRPYYLPPSSSEVYGAPRRLHDYTLRRLQKQDPMEHLGLTQPRSMLSTTRHWHSDKHGETMRERDREMQHARDALSHPKTSGFASNVANYRPKDPEPSDTYLSSTRHLHSDPWRRRSQTLDSATASVRLHESNFTRGIPRTRFDFDRDTEQVRSKQRPEVLARLRARDPFYAESSATMRSTMRM